MSSSKFMNSVGFHSADFDLIFLRFLKHSRSWPLWSVFGPVTIRALVTV